MVLWSYLRYPLGYRDLEEMFRERGFEVAPFRSLADRAGMG